MSSSTTIQLNLSETTLTPNIAAIAAIATNINNNSNTQLHMPPSSFIINDDNFSLDTINTNISKQSHSKSKSKSDPAELKIIMESVESKHKNNNNNNDSKNDIDEIKQDENDLNFLQSHDAKLANIITQNVNCNKLEYN